jgi:hypothetical protein
LLPRSLEENGGTTVELKLSRIDLGHLEDGDSDTDDKKSHDDGDNLTCGGFEALKEDLKEDIKVTNVNHKAQAYHGGDHRTEGDCGT